MPLPRRMLGPVRARRRPLTGMQVANLLALFLPGLAFCLGLLWLGGDPRFAWVRGGASAPWQLWAIAGAGVVATAAGLGDWLYHAAGHRVVGPGERRAEFMALVFGGLPLFVLMAAASVLADPRALLVPVLVVALATVVLIAYDEFTYHRRCGRLEAALHRLLVFGNGAAWLAWVHWCFVDGGVSA